MSADNWAACPRCTQLAEARRQRAETKASVSYGKVPAAEWLKLRRRGEKRRDLEDTLREDYQVGINTETGGFFVTYSATCTACAFSFRYEHEQKAEDETVHGPDLESEDDA